MSLILTATKQRLLGIELNKIERIYRSQIATLPRGITIAPEFTRDANGVAVAVIIDSLPGSPDFGLPAYWTWESEPLPAQLEPEPDFTLSNNACESAQKWFEIALIRNGIRTAQDCAPAINAALDSVAPKDADLYGAILRLPPRVYNVKTPIYIPNRIKLRGDSKRGGARIVQSPDFDGLGCVVLGRRSDLNTFDCRLEEIAVIGSGLAGSAPLLYCDRSQEGSGVSHVIFGNAIQGVRVVNNCANMHWFDLEFHHANSSAGKMFYVADTIPGGANQLHRCTFDGPTATQIECAIYLGGGSWTLSDLHFENTKIGLDLAVNSSGVVTNIEGGEYVNAVMRAQHANFSAHHLVKGPALATLIDLGSSGITYTDPFIECFIPKTIFLGGVKIFDFHANPEGVLTARPGSLALNHGGGAGATLYVKESGNGNTGWVAK